MKKSIKQWARNCIQCQRSKVSRHTKAPLKSFDVPDQRFEHVHVEIIGPLPPSQGFRYCLTMVDRFTRWPLIAPMATMYAETVANTFYATWISRFGCPHRITTDQGRQFEASLMTSLTHLLGIQRHRTTPYRPQSNRMVERWLRTLKAAIMCHETDNWCDLLPTVLLGLRTSVKEDLCCSPAELTYGTQLRIPGEFFFENRSGNPSDTSTFVNQRNFMQDVRAVAAVHHGNKNVFVHPELNSCTHIFLRDNAVRKPLQQPYTGPYEVVQRSDKTVTFVRNGRMTTVNVDE
jgi:transposase InsO family protein